jgi:hypothetical protein
MAMESQRKSLGEKAVRWSKSKILLTAADNR